MTLGSAIVAAGLAFGLVIAGTSAGWLVPEVRVAAVIAMAATIVLWGRSLIRRSDAIDLASAAVVAVVAMSALTSILPRLSAEALFGAAAFTAIFGMSRRLDAPARTFAIRAVAFVGVILTVAFLALWAATLVGWTGATGLPPRLALLLPSGPYGQAHNVALLVGLTLPAIWILRSSSSGTHGRLAATLAIAGGAGLIFLSGGRAVWVAATVASIVAMIPSRAARRRVVSLGRWSYAAIAIFMLAVASSAVLVPATWQSVVQRILAGETLAIRLDIWKAALDAWANAPILGTGPGTFQFAIAAAGYFDNSTYVHHHADSLYIQTLSELGLAGALALGALMVVLAKAWRQHPPSMPVMWTVVFVAIVGIASNPAALGYCALLVAFWGGIEAPLVHKERRESGRVAVALVAATAIGAVPVVATTWAAVSFDAARTSRSHDQFAEAIDATDVAIEFDRTLPPYSRARGTLFLELGRAGDAVDSLRTSVTLNPWDETAWRSLALALGANGEHAAAVEAAVHVTELGRSHALNYATLAYVQGQAGDHDGRQRTLVRLVTLSPWAAFDPAWDVAYPGVQPAAVLREAAGREPDQVPTGVDDRWLSVLSGNGARADDDQISRAEQAFELLLTCSTERATQIVGDPRSSDAGDPMYWLARMVTLRLNDQPIDRALAAFRSAGPAATGYPLEAGGLIDEYAYARRHMPASRGPKLPSQDGGFRAWIDNPVMAVAVGRGGPCAAA
jgi:O-antigen ligase